MMILKRGGNLILGLTDENFVALINGQILRVRGENIEMPGLTFFVMHGTSHDHMRAELRANGYAVDQGDGGDGHGGDGHGRRGDGGDDDDDGGGHDSGRGE